MEYGNHVRVINEENTFLGLVGVVWSAGAVGTPGTFGSVGSAAGAKCEVCVKEGSRRA